MNQTDDLLLDDVSMGILTKLVESFVTSSVHDLLNDIIQLAQHICLLADNRDVEVIRQSEWHLKVNSLIVMLARKVREFRDVSSAKDLLGQLMPLYHEAKKRQDRKATWLRSHPES